MLEPKIRGKRRAGMYVNVPAPKREIKVQNDTVPNYNGFVAYYTSDYNSITNNIKIGNGPDSQLNLQTIMTHEQKHKDNANEGEKGIEGYWMSLEQYYKLCRYNEISANIAEVLYLREEYIQAKTDEEREQIAKTRDGEFSFYFDAIKRGEIDPFTSDPEKFMEEMKFIAQGTQKMWMENHLDFYNENQLPGQVLAYYNRIDNIFVTDRDFYPNEGNYIFAKHIAFGTNLGGIDFTPFIEELDFVPSAIKEADKMIQEGKSADEVRHVLSKEFKEDFKKFENMEYSLSFRQFAALQNVKYLLGDFMSLRTMLIDNETFRESLRGVSDKEIAKRYETLGEARVKYLQAIASGKIKLNPQGIDKTEEEFIGSLIQHCPNISMWHNIIEEWLVGR